MIPRRWFSALLAGLVATLWLAPFAFGTSRDLYLLAGTGGNRAEWFPSALFRVDELQRRSGLVLDRARKRGYRSIQVFHDDRVATLASKFEDTFFAFETDRPLRWADMRNRLLGRHSALEFPLLSMPEEGYSQGILVGRGPQVEPRYGLIKTPLYDSVSSVLDFQAYRQAHLSGWSPVDSLGGLQAFPAKTEGDRLVIRRAGTSVDTEWAAPPGVSFPITEGVRAMVNDRWALVLWKWPPAEEGGGTRFYILDKATSHWEILEVPGGRSRVKGFGRWLGGALIDDSDEPRISLGGDREMAAWAHRYGPPVDLIYRATGLQPRGVLFVYDLAGRAYHTIETRNPDSEVLLIEDSHVYYRVGRQLLRASVGEQGMGPAKRVIEGDELLDVHWAFTAPRYPLQKGAWIAGEGGERFYAVGSHLALWGLKGIAKADLDAVHEVDLAQGTSRPVLRPDCRVEEVAASPDGERLAVGCSGPELERRILVYDPKLEPAAEIRGAIQSWTWTADGRHLAYQTGVRRYYGRGRAEIEPSGIWLRDLEAGAAHKIADQGRDLAACGDAGEVCFFDGDQMVRYAGAETGLEATPRVRGAHYAPEEACYFTPAPGAAAWFRLFARAGKDATAPPTQLLETHPEDPAWGPDCNTLYLTGRDPERPRAPRVYVWDVKNNRVGSSFPGERVGQSGDGKTIVVASDGKLVKHELPRAEGARP